MGPLGIGTSSQKAANNTPEMSQTTTPTSTDFLACMTFHATFILIDGA